MRGRCLFWRSSSAATARLATCPSCPKDVAPRGSFRIFIAVEDKLLPAADRSQRSDRFSSAPPVQVAVIGKGSAAFAGIEPRWEAPNARQRRSLSRQLQGG